LTPNGLGHSTPQQKKPSKKQGVPAFPPINIVADDGKISRVFNLPGGLLVSIWYQFGINLVSIWYQFGITRRTAFAVASNRLWP
jgi:hypothetical protein